LSCLLSVFIVNFLCCFRLGSTARSVFLFVPAPVLPRCFSPAAGACVSLLDHSFTPPSPAAFLAFGVLLRLCSSCSPAGPSQANSFDLLFVFLRCAHSVCSCPQTAPRSARPVVGLQAKNDCPSPARWLTPSGLEF
jgi:hypothetical protein